jgi:hypothetical protein
MAGNPVAAEAGSGISPDEQVDASALHPCQFRQSQLLDLDYNAPLEVLQ